MALLSGLTASLGGLVDGRLGLTTAVALGAALLLLVGYLWQVLQTRAAGKVSGKAASAGSSREEEKQPVGFDVMGEIEPLADLDWKTERPERIYKFVDKYNLTMGG